MEIPTPESDEVFGPRVFPSNMGDTEVVRVWRDNVDTSTKCSGIQRENPKESAGRRKCPMHLLPPEFLIQTANALGHGAARYSAWNWRTTPIKLSTYQGAMMRHLMGIANGEDLDESGFPHLAHIAASAAIVLDAAKHGMLIDDRPRITSPASSNAPLGNEASSILPPDPA